MNIIRKKAQEKGLNLLELFKEHDEDNNGIFFIFITRKTELYQFFLSFALKSGNFLE
jgi:hypothetical protein